MTDLKTQLLLADMNSLEFTNLFTNLEIISKLNVYDKLNTNESLFYIDSCNMLQCIVRYWYGSNRNNTITRLNELIELLEKYFQVYKVYKNNGSDNITNDITLDLPIPINQQNHDINSQNSNISESMQSQPIPIPGTSYKSQELRSKDDDTISMLSLNIGSYQNSYVTNKHKKKRNKKRKELIDHYYNEIIKERANEKNISKVPHNTPIENANIDIPVINLTNINTESSNIHTPSNDSKTDLNTIANNDSSAILDNTDINNANNVNNANMDGEKFKKVIEIMPEVIKGFDNLCVTYQTDNQMVLELKKIITRLDSLKI